jgi:hypothetical protein
LSAAGDALFVSEQLTGQVSVKAIVAEQTGPLAT